MGSKKAGSERGEGSRSGRPTREQSERLTQKIIETSARLFSASSFESTSVDQIVAEARISKQTFYARFESKEAVFAAVTHKGADDLLQSIMDGPWSADPVAVTLVGIGLRILRRALVPESVLLQRVLFAEAQRFPDMARAFHENSSVRTCAFVQTVFEHAMKTGQVRRGDARFLAQQFLHSVVDGQVHMAMLIGRTVDLEVEDYTRRAVDLFLGGCRHLEDATPLIAGSGRASDAGEVPVADLKAIQRI